MWCQAGDQHVHEIETLVQVLYCEFCEIFKKTNFINVYEGLLLKTKIIVRVFFRKGSAFYHAVKEKLFYYEGTGHMFS